MLIAVLSDTAYGLLVFSWRYDTPEASMVYSVSGWTQGVQVKLWDPLRTRAISERLRSVITTKSTFTFAVFTPVDWTLPYFLLFTLL